MEGPVMVDETGELLTPEEVAGVLRVHLQTVYTYTNSGDLRSRKIGRGIRVRRDDLDAFVLGYRPFGEIPGTFPFEDVEWRDIAPRDLDGERYRVREAGGRGLSFVVNVARRPLGVGDDELRRAIGFAIEEAMDRYGVPEPGRDFIVVVKQRDFGKLVVMRILEELTSGWRLEYSWGLDKDGSGYPLHLHAPDGRVLHEKFDRALLDDCAHDVNKERRAYARHKVKFLIDKAARVRADGGQSAEDFSHNED